MSHIEVSDKNELFKMLDKVNSGKPKSFNQKVCPYCQEKQYFIEKTGKWTGCKCKTASPYPKSLPKK